MLQQLASPSTAFYVRILVLALQQEENVSKTLFVGNDYRGGGGTCMGECWNIILNPSAGGGEDNEKARLSRLGDLNLMTTSHPGDALRFARQVKETGGGRLLVIGGDGTLNEVVNGLSPNFEGIQMAVLPGGTGNDFCRALGIPDDMEQAIEALESSMKPSLIDVGRVSIGGEERFFLNASAGGFSVMVSRNLDESSKKQWGSLAYYVSAIGTLPDLQSFHFSARWEDGSLETEAYAWVVANGRYIAGGIPIAPEASFDDGFLDLVVIPGLPLSKLPSFVSELLTETAGTTSTMVKRQGQRIEVETRPSHEFNLDGEIIGSTPVIYEAIPSALMVYQPA